MINQRLSLKQKLLAAGLLALGVAAGPALAAAPIPPSPGGGSPRTPRTPSASGQARDALSAAKAQLNAANALLNRVRSRVEASFKTLPEWQAAQKEHDKAKADLDAATKAVMTKLKARADYKAASDGWEAADAKNRKLQAAPGANPAELDVVAAELFAHATTIRNLEKEALENDPKIMEAKARMEEAKTKFDSFKGQVDAAAMSDPEYQQAYQQVQAAQQQVQAAQQQLLEAQRADAAQKQAEAKARAEAAKAKSRSGGGSGGRSGY